MLGNTPLSIGRRQDGLANCLKGAIDEVRLYNRALSPEEIAMNFRALATGDEPDEQSKPVQKGLVGHWGLDEPVKPSEALQNVFEAAGLEPAYRDLIEEIQ